MKITNLLAFQCLDSRGIPTVAVILKTKKHASTTIVPSGTSTGVHEALELRDGGKAFFGKGVSKAVSNVNKIIFRAVVGKSFVSQLSFDEFLLSLDGTENKSRLGANALLAVSQAFSKCLAAERSKSVFDSVSSEFGFDAGLPLPLANLINGGKHAGTKLDFQEHFAVPVGAKTFGEATQIIVECYSALGKLVEKKFGRSAVNVGFEGGFAPNLSEPSEALELILSAASEVGWDNKIKLGMDAAATSFFDYEKNKYLVMGKTLSSSQLFDYYENLLSKYPVGFFEDAFAEDDWIAWSLLQEKFGSKLLIIGDDLVCTNTGRLEEAREKKACNSAILKLNQIGTVSETVEAAAACEDFGWPVVVAHRSGESEDSFAADFCVGIGSPYCKFGAPARGERTAKYNRLLEIVATTNLKLRVVRS
jgi:enolase